MYVCMYVCTYVCMYVRTYICMYVSTYQTSHLSIHLSSHSSMQMRTQKLGLTHHIKHTAHRTKTLICTRLLGPVEKA
jgi:hypothetical protein